MPGMSGMNSSIGSMGVDDMMEVERFDLLFIDTMTEHHESAIAIAEALLQHGTDPELLFIAQDIVDTQPADIARMQEWRDRWEPNAPAFEMSTDMGDSMNRAHGMGDMAHLHMVEMMDATAMPAELLSAPEEIDRAFANAMILHHQGAHMMMETTVLHAEHPELAGLTGTMLESHHEQIMVLQEWQFAS